MRYSGLARGPSWMPIHSLEFDVPVTSANGAAISAEIRLDSKRINTQTPAPAIGATYSAARRLRPAHHATGRPSR